MCGPAELMTVSVSEYSWWNHDKKMKVAGESEPTCVVYVLLSTYAGVIIGRP